MVGSTPKTIATLLPDLRGGGAETLRVRLAEVFLQRGFRCEFWLSRVHGELVDRAYQSSTIIDLSAPRIRSLYQPLKKCWTARKPDAVIVDMWPNTVVAAAAWNSLKRRGIRGRLLVCDHNTMSLKPECQGFFRYRILANSVRWTYPWADERIAVSNGVADDLANASGLERKEFNVINNPGFSTLPVSSLSDPWPNAGPRILCVGSLKEQKGFSDAIRSLAALNDQHAVLAIIGEGPQRQELANLAAQLEISERVLMPGFSENVHPWYAYADVFCLSSKWEGFGIVIVEAMQHGLQVVSTNCQSGPAEILENGLHGRLVPVGDSQAMANAIQQAVDSPIAVTQLKRRALDFDIDTLATQYLNLLFPEV